MVKSFLNDTFEQLAELGASTVKQTGQAVKQTVSPTKILGHIIGTDQGRTSEIKGGSTEGGGDASEIKKGNKHTPLDFEKLQKSFQNNEKQKLETLRLRYFQSVKSGDERILAEKKQTKEQEKKEELYQIQQRQKEEEEKRRMYERDEPKGKIRKNIFSPKKAAQQLHAEVKPSSGKH